jgi:hypothetical protein
MTEQVGLWRNDAHEYFVDAAISVGEQELDIQAGPLVSVTTAIRAVDKSGPLVGWAKRETAACAVRNLPMLQQMVASGGPSAAQRWLSGIPDYQRDTAADLGTRVHTLAEAEGKGEEIEPTELEAPFVEQYRMFRAEWEPRILACEQMVCSLTHEYAGTLDLRAVIGGETWVLDLKTGAAGKKCTGNLCYGAYPEYGLQLAALGFAEYFGAPGDQLLYPNERPDRFGILHLRPGHYCLVPMNVDGSTFRAFLDALRLWGWLQGPAKSVVGSPLLRERVA